MLSGRTRPVAGQAVRLHITAGIVIGFISPFHQAGSRNRHVDFVPSPEQDRSKDANSGIPCGLRPDDRICTVRSGIQHSPQMKIHDLLHAGIQ